MADNIVQRHAPAAPAAPVQPFADNRLLATFPIDLRKLLRDEAEEIRLEVGDTVLQRGINVDYSVFPLGPTMISMIVELGDGRSIEVASIGKEGAVEGAEEAIPCLQKLNRKHQERLLFQEPSLRGISNPR